MNDPYNILGVSPEASDEEIKKAYKEKARIINPSGQEDELSSLAETKMKELDEAYDAVMRARRSSGANTVFTDVDDSSSTDHTQGSYTPPTYAEIRKTIKKNKLDEAQQMLDRIPEDSKIAEWFFLQGLIQQKKGWLNASYENYKRASEAAPDNEEYRNAYQNAVNQRNGGYNPSYGGRQSSCGLCDCCQGLICADCCCDMMDGNPSFCCCI